MAYTEEILIFSTTFLAISLLIKSFYANEKGKPSSDRRYPPSMSSLPFIGSLPFFIGCGNLADFLMRKAYELGPVFTFKIGNRLCLTLNNRKVIDEALLRHSYSFAGRHGFFFEQMTNPNGKGIVGRNFSTEYKHYRQLTTAVLKEFGFGIKNLIEKRILDEVEQMSCYIRAKNGEPFCPIEMATMGASNVITNIVLSKRQDYDRGLSEIAKLVIAVAGGVDVMIDVAPNILKHVPYFKQRMKTARDNMSQIFDVVGKEIERIKADDSIECFISSYLDKEGQNYDKEQLVYTLRDLLGPGMQTTALTLQWLLIFVANRPEVQGRLQREIDDVIPRDRRPTLDDQSKLPYVQAVILETLRMRSPAPIAVPHLTLTDSFIGGYFVPAGTIVMPNLYAAHMDPKVWSDPQEFQPERFLDKENKIIGKERIISFSLGRRSCLGEELARQELFLFLTNWIQEFTIRCPQNLTSIDESIPSNTLQKPNPFQIQTSPR